jgi:hypothetical protein
MRCSNVPKAIATISDDRDTLPMDLSERLVGADGIFGKSKRELLRRNPVRQ